jgi:gas vesicle protein
MSSIQDTIRNNFTDLFDDVDEQIEEGFEFYEDPAGEFVEDFQDVVDQEVDQIEDNIQGFEEFSNEQIENINNEFDDVIDEATDQAQETADQIPEPLKPIFGLLGLSSLDGDEFGDNLWSMLGLDPNSVRNQIFVGLFFLLVILGIILYYQ